MPTTLLATSGCGWCDFRVTLGELVREKRIAKGLSQRALGAMIGVDGQTISNLEMQHTRSLKLKNLQQLPDAIGVPIEEVMKAAQFAEENVAIYVARATVDRAKPYADAQGIDVAEWINAAIEALMRLQGSPEEVKKTNGHQAGVAGKIGGRIKGTPSRGIAAKNADREK